MVNTTMTEQRKRRKPKAINFAEKRAFRLAATHTDNLAKGCEVFKEDESSYMRRLLSIDPERLKCWLLPSLPENAIEDSED